MNKESFLADQLEKRKQKDNERSLKIVQDCVDLASNDYLGFARTMDWKETPMVGSTGSRLLTGNHEEIEALEAQLARFHSAEAGVIFNSGYTANLGLVSSVATAEDLIIYDAHIHASTQDGMRLSKARLLPFKHQDLDHLENRLKGSPKRKFVCIESVYSCDGSVALLEDICFLCQKYRAYLIVDEAHATGIMGLQGQGLCHQLHCQEKAFARIHTFSKALGSHGAIIVGSVLLKRFLINFCRPFMYTTALPHPILASIKKAYDRLISSDLERENLKKLVSYFKTRSLGFLPSDTPIQSLLVPGNKPVQALSKILQKAGLDVRALISPTVRRGQERLRVILHAYNTKQEIDQFFTCLNHFQEDFLCVE